MRGNHWRRCSSVPMRMIVGATEVTVSGSIGAPAPSSSSTKIHWSMAVRPRPPYSVGQAMPQRPLTLVARLALLVEQRRRDVRPNERPNLVAPRDLLRREVVLHGAVLSPV